MTAFVLCILGLASVGVVAGLLSIWFQYQARRHSRLAREAMGITEAEHQWLKRTEAEVIRRTGVSRFEARLGLLRQLDARHQGSMGREHG